MPAPQPRPRKPLRRDSGRIRADARGRRTHTRRRRIPSADRCRCNPTHPTHRPAWLSVLVWSPHDVVMTMTIAHRLLLEGQSNIPAEFAYFLSSRAELSSNAQALSCRETNPPRDENAPATRAHRPGRAGSPPRPPAHSQPRGAAGSVDRPSAVWGRVRHRAGTHRRRLPRMVCKRPERDSAGFESRAAPMTESDPKQTHVRCPGRRVNPSYVSSRRRVAEPAWSNIFANCSLCFWVGRLRATRCWYVHSSVSACHVASTLL